MKEISEMTAGELRAEVVRLRQERTEMLDLLRECKELIEGLNTHLVSFATLTSEARILLKGVKDALLSALRQDPGAPNQN